MLRQKTLVAVFGAAMFTLVTATAGHGLTSPRRTTNLTFSGPFALPGVSLDRGTYIFERATDSAPYVVRVLSEDRMRIYFAGFTTRIERPAGLDESRSIVFDETPRGQPAKVRAWYPTGELTGYSFSYPQ